MMLQSEYLASPVLVLDWDETITVMDTTALIATVAEKNSPRSLKFLYFTEKYLLSFSDFSREFAKTHGPIDTIEMEIMYQKQLKEVEMLSVKRLEDFKFFEGISITEFQNVASEIEMNSDCVQFLKNWQGHIYILSINWCKAMIQARLITVGLGNIVVLANELETEQGITTGLFNKGQNIRTGLDKATILKELRLKHGHSPIVYIGDSHGDVLPILEADTGIIIANGKGQKVLEKISQVINLDLQAVTTPIKQNSIYKSPRKCHFKVSYVGSWLQIGRFLNKINKTH